MSQSSSDHPKGVCRGGSEHAGILVKVHILIHVYLFVLYIKLFISARIRILSDNKPATQQGNFVS